MQHQSASDAERLRHEIETLRANHAEALQISDQQRLNTKQALQENLHAITSTKQEAMQCQEEIARLKQQRQAVDAFNQELTAELKAFRAQYEDLAQALLTTKKEAQHEQQKLSLQLHALQSQLHQEEEGHVLRQQLQECREQCKVAKEESARKGKAIDRLKAERDVEHANAKKSVELLVTFEERDKKSRKELGRMLQCMNDIRQKTSSTGDQTKQYLETIQKLESQVDTLQREKDGKDASVRAVRASMQHRLTRLHSQLAQVVTWLVRRLEELLRQSYQKAQQRRSLPGQEAPGSVYHSAGILSKSLFAMDLDEIWAGKAEMPKSMPRGWDLEVYLRKLQCAVEGKPMAADSTGGIHDLPTLFYHLVDSRVHWEFRGHQWTAPARGTKAD